MDQNVFLSDIAFLIPEVSDEYVGHGTLAVTDDGGPGEIHAGLVIGHIIEVQILEVLQAGGVDLAVHVEGVACKHVGGRTAALAAIDVRAGEAGAVVQGHRVVRARAVIVAADYFGVHRAALNCDHVACGAAECRVAAVQVVENSTAFYENLVAGGIARKRIAGCHAAAGCAVDVDEVADGFAIAVPAAVDAAADRAAAFYPHAVLGGAARIAVVIALGHTAVDVAINLAGVGNSDAVPCHIADARTITAEYRAADDRAFRKTDGIIQAVTGSGIGAGAVIKSASVNAAFNCASGDVHVVIFNTACLRVQEPTVDIALNTAVPGNKDFIPCHIADARIITAEY